MFGSKAGDIDEGKNNKKYGEHAHPQEREEPTK